MQLLVIRHAIAEDREEFAQSGAPDSERPLTDTGRRRMRRNARGLLRVAGTVDVLATSPYARAAETAQIVATALGVRSIDVLAELAPDRHPRELQPWLTRQPVDAAVAVVGHEPHLGILVTWLVSARDESRFELKKGGACLLELGERVTPGEAIVRWLVTPGQLRSIGE